MIDFEQIKQVPIEQVAHRLGLPLLRNTGKYITYICPHPEHAGNVNHNERGEHARLNTQSNMFYCNCCSTGGHGSNIDLVRHYNHMTTVDAVKYIAGIAGIHIDDGEIAIKRSPRQEMMQIAREFWNNECADGPYHTYWNKRGLSKFTEQLFKPGIAPGYAALTNKLVERGFEKESLVYTGVTTEKGCDYYNRRLLIQTNGNIIGRAITTDANVRVLVGRGGYQGFFNESSLRGKSEAIISEGAFDVIANTEMLHMGGLLGKIGAFATHGTNAYQASWFKRLRANGIQLLYIMTDADRFFNANGREHAIGQKGALTIASQAEQEGIEARICKLPEGEDPNDFLIEIRKGKRTIADFVKLLENAYLPLEFAIDMCSHLEKTQLATAVQKIRFLEKVKFYLYKFGVPAIEDVWETMATAAHCKTEEVKEYLGMDIVEIRYNTDLKRAKHYIEKIKSQGLSAEEIATALLR